MKDVRRSLAITFVSLNAATVVNFLASLVVARLLEPSDIGLFSMTVVFVNILHTFRDFGVTSYILREKDLTPEKIRSASGLLIFTSWSLAAILFMLGHPVSQFYGQPAVEEIMHVLCIGFLLIPFGSITYALLRRNMEAEKQAAVTAFTTFAYAGSCIGFAALDFGYMSMAWANLVNIIATIIAYTRVRPKEQPFLPSIHGWRPMIGFGGGSVLSNLVTNLNNAIPDIMLGKRLDANAVGLFSRANGLVELFGTAVMPAINNAALPVIARNFHEKRPLAPDLCRTSSYLTGLAWPILVTTALFAHDIVLTLYGAKWLDCLPIVTLLCISYAARIPFALTSHALIAMGRPYLSAITVGGTIVLKLLVIWLSDAKSLVGFVQAFVLADLLIVPVTLFVWIWQFKVSSLSFLRAHLSSLALLLPCLLVILSLDYLLPSHFHPGLRISIVATIMTFVWIGSAFLVRHPVSAEIRLMSGKVLDRWKIRRKTV